MKQTFDDAPDTIQWQGEKLYLLDIKPFPANRSKPYGFSQDGLDNMVRFSYGTRRPNGTTKAVKLMQFQFEGRTIDWERLEQENSQAPELPVIVAVSVRHYENKAPREYKLSDKQRAYYREAQRRFRQKQQTEKRRLQDTPDEAKG